MSSPMIRRAFDAYREAVEAEQALIAQVQAREDKRPTAEQQSEFDRLEATIAERKAELDAAVAFDGPQPTDAAQTVVRIHQASKGRTPTTAQTRDLDAAVDELLTASDVADSGALAHARDQLARALKDRNTAEAALWAPEVARLVTVHHRTREVDAARAPLASLFTQDDRMERTTYSSAGGPSFMYNAIRQVQTTGQPLVYEFDVQAAATGPEYDVRALASSGGSAIPTDFHTQVAVYSRTETWALDPNIVTVLGRRSGAPIVLPRLTADPSFAGTLTAEAATLTEADATLSSVTLNPYKYGGIQVFSAELDEDEIIGFDSMIARSFARELSLDFDGHATTGTGSSQPNGIVTAAGNGGTATKSFGGTATTFYDAADLVSLYMSVPAPVRKQGAWLMSNSAITKALTFRDDNGNRVIFEGLTGTGSLSLLGRPIHEAPSMAAVGSASKSVLFGDLRSYVVAEVQPLRVEVSRDWKFGSDQIAIKVVRRLDSDLLDSGAVKYLVSANT